MKRLCVYGLIVAAAIAICDGIIAVHGLLYPSEYSPADWEYIGSDGKSLGPAPAPTFNWEKE